jgi:hypothetical protein
MKIYYILSASLILFLTGCSTYTIKNFYSKEKFYQDFNKSAKNKDVSITLVYGKSFDIDNGVILENDSLISYEKSGIKGKMTVPLTDITDLLYTDNNHNSASVIFKNGGIIEGDNITVGHDSICFDGMKQFIVRKSVAPINKVETVSYINNARAVPSGIFGGALAGLITAGIASVSLDKSNKPLNYWLPAPLIGAVVGGIIAVLIGWNTTYQFNP